MQPTDARTPTDPPRPGSRRGPRRPDRSRWLVLLVAVGITAGVGAGAVHGDDRGFLASFCDALERTESPGEAAAGCAVAADSR